MASVTIGQAQKYFGQTHIIKGVSIDINDGEFCVLIGPSGRTDEHAELSIIDVNRYTLDYVGLAEVLLRLTDGD